VTEEIICLHGLGRTPSDWEPTRGALAAIGTVRCPSLPARPELALQALDHLIPAGAIVIGHSMGAALTMRLLSRRPRPLRAVVLTGCFYPPARNGRSTAATFRDYSAHRFAFLRESRRERTQAAGRGTAAALGSLIHQVIAPGTEESALDRLAGDVLIVHARDDHHVPVDFAIAAARRHPRWTLHLLEHGGHHAHVRDPVRWSATVIAWLRARDTGRIGTDSV
jgi:pimeloyl-ACP methyl ester carboxylesterase